MKFIIPVSILSGLLLTLIFSLSTAKVTGRNIETGETFVLHYWDAVQMYVSHMGFSQYLLVLLPVFLAFSVLTGITLFLIMRKKQRQNGLK